MEKVIKGYTVVTGKKLHFDDGGAAYFGGKKTCQKILEVSGYESRSTIAKATLTVEFK